MKDPMKKWKDQVLSELEIECKRLMARINKAKKETGEYSSYEWAAVKRSSLDLNRVGARLRAGYYKQFN
jgi:hypothetical protein